MKNVILILIVILYSTFGAFGQTFTSVKDLPTEKSYVFDPANLLDMSDRQIVESQLKTLEQSDSMQVAVVMLESIGSNVPKDFAVDLFNHWRVGHSGRDDGLLILFVLNQRRIEFETGYGLEAVLSDVQCKNIQTNYMIPAFKKGAYSEGIQRGVEAVVEHLQGKGELIERNQEVSYENNQGRIKRNTFLDFLRIYLPWHLVGVVIFLIALLVVRMKNDPYDKYNVIKYFHAWVWIVLFPITHIVLYFIARGLKERYRNMIRFSGRTNEIMRKLSEEDEDEYLTKGQVTEELIRSVDYDVWVTDNSDDVLILEYRPFFSGFSRCPKCTYRTYFKLYDKQITAPSYVSAGQGERRHECKNCNHIKVKRYSIPRLKKTARVASGSSSWGGRGGGSWGGGFSGGGGAGSSW